jgi:hypothetical protein
MKTLARTQQFGEPIRNYSDKDRAGTAGQHVKLADRRLKSDGLPDQ